MIAKVRRRSTSVASGDRAGAPSGARIGMFMVAVDVAVPAARIKAYASNPAARRTG